MNLVRVDRHTSIVKDKIVTIVTAIHLVDRADSDIRTRYVDNVEEIKDLCDIKFRIFFDTTDDQRSAADYTFKTLKLTNLNAKAQIAHELVSLMNDSDMDNLHDNIISAIIPLCANNTIYNVESRLGMLMDNESCEPAVNLKKQIEEICEKVLSTHKSPKLGATLLAHKASRSKKEK